MKKARRKSGGIGTLGEYSLHADLKRWYAHEGDKLEVNVDGFVVDVMRGELLVEIQTGNFNAIKRKLAQLADLHPLRLVYPIAQEKWIVRLPARTGGRARDGKKVLSRRLSPKRGRLLDIFDELVHIPSLLREPTVSFEALLIEEEEVRRDDGRGSWWRRGISTLDRRLIRVVSRNVFEGPKGFLKFLPSGLPQPFTTRNLAEALDEPHHIAQKIAYTLREMGAIRVAGKRKNAILYSLREDAAPGLPRRRPGGAGRDPYSFTL